MAEHIPSTTSGAFRCCRKFDLNAVYAVHTVDEENKDEDEGNLEKSKSLSNKAVGVMQGYLHPIL